MLHAANLGDSGFMVIRGDSIVFKSRTQQHSFNFPFQLGRGGNGVFDPPIAADVSPSLFVSLVMGVHMLFSQMILSCCLQGC